MSKQDLSSVLWRERELLELLLFKLEVEQLLLANSRTQWLPAAAREVEVVLGQVRDSELLRTVSLATVADELGLDTGSSLRQIAEASQEPWRSIWLDHRAAFTTVTSKILDMAENNKTLITAGYRAVQATLQSLTETPQTYAADGTVAADRPTSLLDRSL